MVDDSEKIEKKLEEIEARLTRLEGLGVAQKQVSEVFSSNGSQNESKSPPVGSIIALVIGGLILWNSLPALLFGYFFGNSYGYGSISLIIVFFGASFVALGVRGIARHKRDKGEGQIPSVKPALTTFGATNQLEVGSVSQKVEQEEKKEKNEDSIEFQIASHWFSIVGIVAILLGVVFFLKYAFDNNLIGPVGQVSIGVIFGICLLFVGEFFRSKYQQYSQIITGGGIGVLYLSLWAAFAVFSLIDRTTVLGAMSLVTITSALLAVRYDAIYIAALGVLGGFATPALLARGFDNEILLLSYILILNLGVLFVAFFKNWRPLNILTFAGTYLVFTSWYSSYYEPGKLLLTFVFLTLLFVIFSFVWVVYNMIYDKKIEETDLLLMVFNASVYFGYSYLLLLPDYKDLLGFFAFGMSVYYFIFGYIAYTKFKAESALTLGNLGISIIFLTVAVPLQVKSNLITLIWAVEGAVILWLGFWLSSYKLRVGGLAIYILVAIRLLYFDSVIPSSEFILFLNRRFLTYIVAAISAGVASWLFATYKAKIQEDERIILPIFLIGLNVILVAALTLESVSFFDAKISTLQKNLYRSEIPTAVLGQQVITRAISSALDDNSILCGGKSGAELFLGVDNICNPPAKIVTHLTFGSLDIPSNAYINSAYVSFMSLDNSPTGGSYKIDVQNANLGTNTNESKPYSWPSTPWVANSIVSTSNIAPAIQDVLDSGSWQAGNSMLVTIEPYLINSVYGLFKIDSYEQNPQNSAKLTVIYSVGDITTLSPSISPLPIGNTFQNGGLNDYRNNYRAIPSPLYNQKPYVAPQIDSKVQAEIKTLTGARDFSISAIWLFYSLMLLVVGVLVKYKPIRLSALVFFAVTILKVFLLDSSNLSQMYRIIAFIGLGTILLVVAYIYQRYKAQVNAFLLNG